MNPEYTPQTIVSLLALGTSLSFIVADRSSPISRTLSAFLACIGISIAVNVLIGIPLHLEQGIPAWDGLFAIPETLAFVLAYEWLLRVRRTIPAGKLNTRGADNMLRVAQGLALFYGAASLIYPQLRVEHFLGPLRGSIQPMHPAFYLFATPLAVSLLLGTACGLLMFNRRPDRAEVLRGLAFLVGAPFMARFLSPQVARLVSERGLKSATEEQTLEISVVCCDLRGFTAFSAATSSQKVIQILREYYDAVGEAAAAFGGTIKDQAGDGVLILVGAPIALDDHAQRAMEMAKQIRLQGVAVTERWSDSELRLGVGVGVASGFVTVGVIGAGSRLEYTAVGPAVNLSARLCSEALHAQILFDPRTLELLTSPAQRSELQPGESLLLKGFPAPVQSYVIAA